MRHHLFNISIDNLSSAELDQLLIEWLNGNAQKFITTPNPEFVLLARRDEEFKKILQSSDLSLPDGVGLRFGIAALTDETLSHRHTGVDLVERLAYLSHRSNRHLLLVGGAEGSAEKTKQLFEQKFPGIKISVYNPGRIDLTHMGTHEGHPYRLAEYNADILLVALGQKKQELFIKQTLPHLPSVRIAVGVGGAFEMISNMKPRAPRFMSRMGLEWLWRVVIEPKRIGRILNASFVFPLVVISATLKQHRFWKACRNVIPEIYRQITGL